MLRRFWKTMSVLALIIIIYSGLSWWFLYAHHTQLQQPRHVLQLLSIPLGLPSIWSIVHPTTTVSAIAPIVQLLLSVLLSGGLLGTLIRININREVSIATFFSDSIRPFWRLLGWNILWNALFLMAAMLTHVLTPLGYTASLLLLVVRFVFLFTDTALVAEQQTSARIAIFSSARTLFNALGQMLPYGIAVATLTGLATAIIPNHLNATSLSASLLYSLIMLWLLHLIVARYLFYSDYKHLPEYK